MASKVLLEEQSPYGNIVALVEDLGDTIYFSLYGPENIIPLGEDPDSWTSVRSSWVCNTHPMPDTDVIDMDKILATMQQGLAPTMPAKHCQHARTGLKLDKDQLEIVWFEEGDCAALLYKGAILAAIPPWATPSASEYVGYAKEFKGEPFLDTVSLDAILPAMIQRVKHAQNFWFKWHQFGTWGNFLNTYMKIFESYFGKHIRYFAIDGGGFPHKGIAVFEKENALFFITIGMSILAQPRVELYVEHPEQFRRIELGMAVDKEIVKEVSIEKIVQFISSTAAMPWNQFCWFGHEQTLRSELFKDHTFNNVVFVDRSLEFAGLPLCEEDPIKLLWLLPITDKEFAYKQEHSAEDLINKLETSQGIWVYKPRPSVVT